MASQAQNEKRAIIQLAESLESWDYNKVIEILKENNLLKTNK